MTKPNQNLLFGINNMLLLSGIVTALTGLTIMLHYHMGNHGGIIITERFLGIDYTSWSWIHKTSTIVMSLLATYHILLHWNWYKNVFHKKLVTKNRQVLFLSFIFSISFLTGFIPWLLQVSDITDFNRRFLLEIHDKTGRVLIIFLILHLRKRLKWFKSTYKRLESNL